MEEEKKNSTPAHIHKLLRSPTCCVRVCVFDFVQTRCKTLNIWDNDVQLPLKSHMQCNKAMLWMLSTRT